jgi:multiple antibiotic resistance protein
VILGLAALFGAKALHVFGVSLDAFSVAGGFVLAWMGFGMIKSDSNSAISAAADDATATLSPLILFAASPGTITGVITLAVAHSRMSLPITALIAIGVAVVVTVAAMALVELLGSRNQGGLASQTITHLMGLIVLAMGIQFGLTGLKNFMG